MVGFDQLQKIVAEQLEQDRNIQSVTSYGATLEEAVAEAAILLDLPVRRLEYEIIEYGNSGVMGIGKKKWSIKAYERIFFNMDEYDDHLKTDIVTIEEHHGHYMDGDVFINLRPNGAYLKVIPPQGRGRKVRDIEAFNLLLNRNIEEFDKGLVSNIVREAAGEYIWVAHFEHDPAADSTVTVELADSEMRAYIAVSPPGRGGCDASLENYLNLLRGHRVHFGINEDHLKEFIDKPLYGEKVCVAEGLKAEDGRDAYIHYNFETDQNKIKLRERSDGRIDFKDLNIINNVVEKQPLAKKIPPGKGIAGKTITGKTLPAKNGKDIPLPVGKNVHVGEDGATIIADMSGQVIINSGKINVEPIYTVQGGVNLKTGNIMFLGTVVINGNIDDGFEVKAAGNIEVNGTVERANLDAEGDIIVHQGITGKNSSTIRAGRSIWARFIENTNVEAGHMVVVADGIVNSNVDANKRIVCNGKRAHIVGGRLRATEEINAKNLGSPTSHTETICEVGSDPKSKMRLELLFDRRSEMDKQLEEVKRNLQTLLNIKRLRKTLSQEKEAQMEELVQQRHTLIKDLAEVAEEITKIQEFLGSIKTRSRISASSKVYPGVRIIIRDTVNDVRDEYKAVTFILEDELIRMTKYEEPDEEAMRGPDGYTAN